MDMEFNSTDEKIITATFGILQKEGVVKATTKRIAAEAGVDDARIQERLGRPEVVCRAPDEVDGPHHKDEEGGYPT